MGIEPAQDASVNRIDPVEDERLSRSVPPALCFDRISHAFSDPGDTRRLVLAFLSPSSVRSTSRSCLTPDIMKLDPLGIPRETVLLKIEGALRIFDNRRVY